MSRVGGTGLVAWSASTGTVPSMALPTLMELIRRSTDFLASHGIGNARRETEWIFAETLGLTRLELYTRFDMPLEDAEVGRLRQLVQRRGRREPLAYVLGSQEFCSLRLTVGPGVLVPRPETEELVGRVLKALSPGAMRVLDVGTGSGAIALALKHQRGECLVEATDASHEALAIARANGERLGLPVIWHHGHLAMPAQGPFMAVVANLPYIGAGESGECDPELAFEPASALFAEEDGLALIRELIADARRLLAPGGSMWLEHGWKQGAAVREIAAVQGLACETIPDIAGRDRFARIAAQVVA
jgi:release factor glutamine methyltransferase